MINNTQYGYDDTIFFNLVNFVRNCMQYHLGDVSFLRPNQFKQTNSILEIAKQNKQNSEDIDDRIHGATLMPDDENDDIIIYIETSKIGVPTIIETLTHEIVHAYDFKQFSKIYKRNNISQTEYNEKFDVFCNFSEFHAYTYATMYSPRFIDEYYGVSRSDTFLNIVVHQITEEFLKLTTQSNSSEILSYYQICRLLAEIFVVDLCCGYKQDNSCGYIFLPQIFHSKESLDIVYRIYEIFVCLLYRKDIDSYLCELTQLFPKVHHKLP